MAQPRNQPIGHGEDVATLAQSINGNANLARSVIGLLLLLSLYLFLTLVASTDKNLLLDGQVVLPQLGVGLSVSASYLLGPPVFLYLHAQALLVLTTLARQLRTYEGLVRARQNGGRRADQPNSDQRLTSLWDLLSAFPFAQMYVPKAGTALISRSLVWMTVVVIPVSLLLAIDLSFLRFQSWPTTLFHHTVLVLDVLVAMRFSACFQWGSARRDTGSRTSALFRRAFGRLAGSRPPATFGSIVRYLRHVPLLSILVLLLAYARPPGFDVGSLEEDRERIWGQPERGFWVSVFSGENVLDAGPCEWWGRGCRFLNVRDLQPVLFGGASVVDATSSVDSLGAVRTPELTGRVLRFARLHGVNLTGADLRDADLRGAEMDRSVLLRADLSEADLTGARLGQANLQGATLLRAKFDAADLYRADLRGATMVTADFMGAKLHEAQLAGADMELACLAGSDLMSAGLQGADLGAAYMQGADLSGALLHGANLESANLLGADLGQAVLDGANLRGAELGLTGGFPASLLLTTLEGATYRSSESEAGREFRSELCAEDLWTLPSPLVPGETIEEAIETSLRSAVADQTKRTYWRLVWNTSHGLPDETPIQERPDWQALRDWTTDFACRNRFTALGTLRRWRYFDRMDNLPVPSTEWRSTRDSLAARRKDPRECQGLAALPESVLESYMLGWR